MRYYISLQENKIVIEDICSSENKVLAASFNAELMQLGYMMDENLYTQVAHLPHKVVKNLYRDVINELRQMKGADVDYKPFYPNFPKQVMEMSEFELYSNAIIHYWTFGQWLPYYEKEKRSVALEEVNYTMLSAMSEEEFRSIFTQKICANDSISQDDKKIVEWFIDNYGDLEYPQEIPFKENLCLVAAKLLEKGEDISHCVKTATDVLRVATYLSKGDISLAQNTKFVSLPRKTRKALCRILENVISQEDIQRHKNKWIRLFHNLHVGEYSAKLFSIAAKFRNNKKITTFNGRVEAAILIKDVKTVVRLLEKRPGDFARRLDHVLRLAQENWKEVQRSFAMVADGVSTRVLLQLLGHFKAREAAIPTRVVFPKGAVQKARLLTSEVSALTEECCKEFRTCIEQVLQRRFFAFPSLGKVWIDPKLAHCPLPSQQRSASKSLFRVARGTQLDFGDKNTLRFFVYWIGRDIDLSASLHNEDFSEIEHISYTNLKSSKYKSCHSGDITWAPKPDGASEFIDISVDEAFRYGARYVVMNVYVYYGPNFSEHEKCYVGWMTRNEVQSNEIYDPKTVQQKVDLLCESRSAIPCVFDLQERKMIWCDLAISWRENRPNNIENNIAATQEILQAVTSLHNKTNLHELLTLHAKVRGELVDNVEDADSVFSIDYAYKISEINSKLLADKGDENDEEIVGYKSLGKVLEKPVSTLKKWRKYGLLPPGEKRGIYTAWKKAQVANLLFREDSFQDLRQQ